jgi:ATP-dependent Lon protease
VKGKPSAASVTFGITAKYDGAPQGFLILKALRNHGLNPAQVTIRKDALAALIDDWAREAGVRTLENRIKKIMRKAARAQGADLPGREPQGLR